MRIPIGHRTGCVTMTNTGAEPAGRGRASFFVFSGLVFAISAAVTIYFCRSMSGGMTMPGGWTMSMMWMRMPGQTWTASFAMFLLMWLAMMVAMMLPSALPMLSNFHRSAGKTNVAGVTTMLVACGYFIIWMVVGIVVYGVGMGWACVTMQSPILSRAVPTMTGTALILAGFFQFTRWKAAGLKRCREPFCVRSNNPCIGPGAGFSHGIRQGVSCMICCAGIMLAAVAIGVMNPAVMLVVGVVIAVEKMISKPQSIVRWMGIAAIFAGIVVLLRSIF
jgi:predicted metal-binding membrane protein